MGKVRKVPGNVSVETSKSSKEKLSDKSKGSHNSNTPKGWRDVFDKLTYSSGPGDNIYVFG